jgi:hypothetical protein
MFHNDAKRFEIIKVLIISFLYLCQTLNVVAFLHTLGVMATDFKWAKRICAHLSMNWADFNPANVDLLV